MYVCMYVVEYALHSKAAERASTGRRKGLPISCISSFESYRMQGHNVLNQSINPDLGPFFRISQCGQVAGTFFGILLPHFFFMLMPV